MVLLTRLCAELVNLPHCHDHNGSVLSDNLELIIFECCNHLHHPTSTLHILPVCYYLMKVSIVSGETTLPSLLNPFHTI